MARNTGRVNYGITVLFSLSSISEFISYIGDIWNLPYSIYHYLSIENKKVEREKQKEINKLQNTVNKSGNLNNKQIQPSIGSLLLNNNKNI